MPRIVRSTGVRLNEKSQPRAPKVKAWTSERERAVARRAAMLDTQLELLLESRGQLCRTDSPDAGSFAQRRTAQVDRLRASMASIDPNGSGDATRLWLQAEASRWELALSAWHLAERESRRVRIPELTRADVANEAAVGLYDAAVRFDPDLGFQFTTYARWWIRAQTKGAIAAAHLIVRLPDSARRQRARLMTAGSSLADVASPRRRHASHLLSSFASVSWQHVPAGGGHALEDTMSDPTVPSVEDSLATAQDHAIARRALFASEEGVHKRIVMARFGLGREEPRTLRVVGTRLGVSAERVRQLEREALRTLREEIDRAHALPTCSHRRDGTART
jgi:RNA polymerase sigma factor (sigma-70 family)